jgi:hypothetical protein
VKDVSLPPAPLDREDLNSFAVRMKFHWGVAFSEKSFWLEGACARPLLLQDVQEVVFRRCSEHDQGPWQPLCLKRSGTTRSRRRR